jgi:hypothetical protein
MSRPQAFLPHAAGRGGPPATLSVALRAGSTRRIARPARPGRLAALFVALFVATGASPALAAATAQLRVVTTPEGAEILCDGVVRDLSPTTVQNLTPGSHLVVARKEGFREARRTVTVMEGQKAAVELKLEPLLGLVLVHTQPPGAEVHVNGAFRGQTPVAIPDFPMGVSRLKLVHPGFFEKEVELNVVDRTPQYVNVSLVADSVTVRFTSNPTGSSVLINGATRGETPCEVAQIPSGEIEIEIRSAGFEPYREKVSLKAGDVYEVDARLHASPGSLQIVTLPEKARVYVENQLRGDSPVLLENISPGDYRVRVEMEGFETVARTVRVAPTDRTIEEFRLASNSGAILLISEPPGARVFVDGKECGATRASAAGLISEPLRVDRLPRGEHTLQLTRTGYSYAAKRIRIEADKVLNLHEKMTRLFIPDIRLQIKGATEVQVVTGVLLEEKPDGSLVVEVRPGVIVPYPRAEILHRETIRGE